jgi:hypothetical protein
MTILQDGNVGIGTITPTAKLEIGGTAGVDGIKFPDGTLQTTAAAAACPSGFTAVASNGRRLGCIQTDEADFDGDTTRNEAGDTANWNPANEYCFDTFGGRLPFTTEMQIAMNNFALTNEADDIEWTADVGNANDVHSAVTGNGTSEYVASDTNPYSFRCWLP